MDGRVAPSSTEEAVWMLDLCVRQGFAWEKGGYAYHQACHGQAS